MSTSMVTTIDRLRQCLRQRRTSNSVPIGIVPTMGALHNGHAKLIETARESCQTIVVTIFVNPLQFNNQEDLEKYPSTLTSDLAMCKSLNVNYVFVPNREEMYPKPAVCSIKVNELGDYMEGLGRPGHFDEMATIVLKLFMIVQPDLAYFGEKDIQQLAIVKRMVSDFNIETEIIGVPTVRESDGLAMSSRNLRLSCDGRGLASVLYCALNEAKNLILNGDKDVNHIVAKAKNFITSQNHNIRLEYLNIVDEKFKPIDRIEGPVVVAGALWVDGVRLIDNIQIENSF